MEVERESISSEGPQKNQVRTVTVGSMPLRMYYVCILTSLADRLLIVWPKDSVPCAFVECCATSPRSPAFTEAALIWKHKEKLIRGREPNQEQSGFCFER